MSDKDKDMSPLGGISSTPMDSIAEVFGQTVDVAVKAITPNFPDLTEDELRDLAIRAALLSPRNKMN